MAGPPTLVLIGCLSRKAPGPCPARLFYIGTLFKASVAWAESCRLPWCVVSTKYGILMPDALVEPYNETFSNYARGAPSYRTPDAMWKALVMRQLMPYRGWRLLSILGGEYERALPDSLWKPFKSLRLGPRVNWLRTNLNHLPTHE